MALRRQSATGVAPRYPSDEAIEAAAQATSKSLLDCTVIINAAYPVIRADVLRECDCCRRREALERIAQGAGNGRPSLDAAEARALARQALGEPASEGERD